MNTTTLPPVRDALCYNSIQFDLTLRAVTTYGPLPRRIIAEVSVAWSSPGGSLNINVRVLCDRFTTPMNPEGPYCCALRSRSRACVSDLDEVGGLSSCLPPLLPLQEDPTLDPGTAADKTRLVSPCEAASISV